MSTPLCSTAVWSWRRVLPNTLRFGDPRRREISLFDSKSRKYYSPRRNTSGGLENDYGIIISCTNPFAPKKRQILGTGSFGYGTWACIRFLLSNEYLSHDLVKKDAEFLVEADVVWGAPQQVKLLVSRKIRKSA
jgi:hypothetical protein